MLFLYNISLLFCYWCDIYKHNQCYYVEKAFILMLSLILISYHCTVNPTTPLFFQQQNVFLFLFLLVGLTLLGPILPLFQPCRAFLSSPPIYTSYQSDRATHYWDYWFFSATIHKFLPKKWNKFILMFFFIKKSQYDHRSSAVTSF